MRYITCTLAVLALLNIDQTSAIRVRDDLFKDLAKDLAADMDKEANDATEKKEEKKPEPAKKAEEKKPEPAKKTQDKKPADKKAAAPAKAPVKKEEPKKKEEDEIPMDTAAIKAYSSVIADAAEDSEPSKPVIYTETMQEEHRSTENVGLDPMGSMIQNEISSIKEASIKAAQESSE